MIDLKKRRKNLGLTMREVADYVGVSEGTVSRWESGDIANMKRTRIVLLADILKVSPYDIIDIEDSSNPSALSKTVKGIRIPVLGTVHAGIPIDAIEDIIDYEEITPQLASSGEFFALKIKGDCMSPKMTEGNIIIVRCQSEANNGDIVVATVNGEEAVVRKLQKYDNGIALIPTNPVYEPIRFSAEEIKTLPVEIIGKAVELRAKL